MAGLTCDYCGQGDNEKGQVQVYNGGVSQMHAPCWREYCDEQKNR
jgi:hypothetical protein